MTSGTFTIVAGLGLALGFACPAAAETVPATADSEFTALAPMDWCEASTSAIAQCSPRVHLGKGVAHHHRKVTAHAKGRFMVATIATVSNRSPVAAPVGLDCTGRGAWSLACPGAQIIGSNF